jgi:uncharacterized Zn finger protein
VKLDGRLIARTFWGKAWCENLERYSDFANRLPRGRTYVRNGSVIDLQITKGTIKAVVSGSEIYRVTISIDTLRPAVWKNVKSDCSQSIDSLFDLMQGRFDEGVMSRLTARETGLFPAPKEIKIKCSCPDWAVMCKHVAAVLYGVGARLDTDPEMLFTLRNVDHLELIGSAVSGDNLDRTLKSGSGQELAGDLGEIFGIELDTQEAKAPPVNNDPPPVADAPGSPAKRARNGRKDANAKALHETGEMPRPESPSRVRKGSPKKGAAKKTPGAELVVSGPSRKRKESNHKRAVAR